MKLFRFKETAIWTTSKAARAFQEFRSHGGASLGRCMNDSARGILANSRQHGEVIGKGLKMRREIFLT